MIPAFYNYINAETSQYSPSMLHFSDNNTTQFFEKYLLQDAINTVRHEGIPEMWDKNYLQYILFGIGYIAVFNHDEFGIIPQQCRPYGYNVFYNPAKVVITNPCFKKSLELAIGEDCEIVKLQPNWSSVMDIVKYYSEKLALLSCTFDSTALNSKLAYLFAAKNKAAAESIKKLYDKVASGEPLAVYDKELIDEKTGKLNIELFSQNVRENYIANEVLASMTTVLNQFRTSIGIPNAEFEKQERLIVDEVNSNNTATNNKHDLWLRTLNEGWGRVNSMFGLNITAISNVQTQNSTKTDGGEDDESDN